MSRRLAFKRYVSAFSKEFVLLLQKERMENLEITSIKALENVKILLKKKPKTNKHYPSPPLKEIDSFITVISGTDLKIAFHVMQLAPLGCALPLSYTSTYIHKKK